MFLGATQPELRGFDEHRLTRSHQHFAILNLAITRGVYTPAHTSEEKRYDGNEGLNGS